MVDAIPLLIVSREMSPSRSRETLLTMLSAFTILKRPFQPFFNYGAGHAVYLNQLVQSLFAVIPEPIVRVLYVEDDILIPGSEAHQIALTIAEAEKNNWNIITNYKLADGRNVIHHADRIPYTDSEIERLKLGDRVDLSGMGFYFGTFYRDYRFHEGDWSSIDWTFFKEKGVELHYSPIVCQHVKMGYY